MKLIDAATTTHPAPERAAQELPVRTTVRAGSQAWNHNEIAVG